MQNLHQYKKNPYEVFEIQEELILTAENGEIYAVDYGEVDTLSYLNGLLTQIGFKVRGKGSWVLDINSKCSLNFYYSSCLNSYDSNSSVSNLFWRGEYSRISNKKQVITGAFLIQETSGRVVDSELLGEEVIDRIRDFLDEVDRLIEIDNIHILGVN